MSEVKKCSKECGHCSPRKKVPCWMLCIGISQPPSYDHPLLWCPNCEYCDEFWESEISLPPYHECSLCKHSGCSHNLDERPVYIAPINNRSMDIPVQQI